MISLNTFYHRVNQAIDDSFVIQRVVEQGKVPSLSFLAQQCLRKENLDVPANVNLLNKKVPRLTGIAAKKVCDLQIDLSKISPAIQENFLKAVHFISDWSNAQALCLPSINKELTIERLCGTLQNPSKSAKKILKHPEDFMLSCIYRVMLRSVSKETQNEIIALSRPLQPFHIQWRNTIVRGIPKCFDVLSKIAENKYIAAAIVGGFLCTTIVPINLRVIWSVIPLSKNFSLYNYFIRIPFVLFFMTAFIDTTTRNMFPRLHRWFSRPLFTCTLILHMPLMMTIWAIYKVYTNPHFCAHEIKKISNKCTELAQSIELSDAGALWKKEFFIKREQTCAKIKQLQNRVV